MTTTFTITSSTQSNIHSISCPSTRVEGEYAGILQFWNNVYTKETPGVKKVLAGQDSSQYYKGFMEWDVSDFPNHAIVSSVDAIIFQYHTYKRAHAGWKVDCYLKACNAVRPSTGSAMHIFNTIASSSSYSDGVDFPLPSGIDYGEGGENRIETLNATARTDFFLSLSIASWFGMGMEMYNPSAATTYASIWYDNDDANPMPTLLVTYSTSTSVYLDKPSSIVRSYSKKIATHVFPDGASIDFDRGKRAKTVTLNGIQMSNAETKMSYMDELVKSGNYVSLSGLENDDLNTDWYIEDFTWEQAEGYVNRYDYSLTLREK